MSKSVVHKLNALQYPGMSSQDTSLARSRDFRKVLVWNECENVRAQPADCRGWMIEGVDLANNAQNYGLEFVKYITNLGAPECITKQAAVAVTSDDDKLTSVRVMLLDYALRVGINMCYGDEKNKYSMVWTDSSKEEELDFETLVDLLRPQFQLFGFSCDGLTMDLVVGACREICRRCYSELSAVSLELQKKNGETAVKVEHAPKEVLTGRKTSASARVAPTITREEALKVLDSLTTVDTGNTEASRVVSLLRMVHTSELELLQCSVNEIVAFCQETSVNYVPK